MSMQTRLGKRLEEAWAVIDTLRGKLDASTDQIAALTAQNEALVTGIQQARAQLFEAALDDAAWKAVDDALFSLISLTPADALKRREREDEERRLMEAVENSAAGCENCFERVKALDNFRKGAGR